MLNAIMHTKLIKAESKPLEERPMQTIIIDEEFERILPKLDEQTYTWLEENILEYGCREPLVLWDSILIDGHNRYSILKKHDLPINTVNMEFDSRDEVLIWIISTQVSRRNLNPLQLSYYRGLHYHADKSIVTNASGRNQYSEDDAQNGHHPKTQPTASRLSAQYNVSRNTIRRDAQIAKAINAIGEASPEAKTDILSGKAQISRRQLQELSSGKEDTISEVVMKIKDGTIERRRTGVNSATNGGVDPSQDSNSNSDTSNVIDINELHSWELQLSKMTNELTQAVRSHARINDTESILSALRQHIKMLEELCEEIQTLAA